VSEDLLSPDVAALALSPGFPENHTVAAASTAGVFVSQDAGLHWKLTAEGPAGQLTFSPKGRLLAASFPEQGVRATEDLGETWRHVPGPWHSGARVVGLAVNNASEYAVAVVEGAGQTLTIWQGLPGHFERILSRPAGPNPLVSFFVPSEAIPDRPWYASLESSVLRFSARKGRPYAEYTLSGREGQGDQVLFLTGAYSPSSQVLFATTGQRLFKSTDAAAWTLVHDFGSERAVALAPSPAYAEDKSLYVLLLGGTFCRVVIR
jgi:hypothetical protein